MPTQRGDLGECLCQGKMMSTLTNYLGCQVFMDAEQGVGLRLGKGAKKRGGV